MTCSNHNHPEGDHLPYLAHLEWLELMSKTHRQIKMPDVRALQAYGY